MSVTTPAGPSRGDRSRANRISTYAEFWPYYLEEHRRPATRALHYFGTSLAIGLLVFAVVTQTWWLLIAVPIAGYMFAWIGHFFVERNRPATFAYPLWSLASDFVMLFRWLTGRLGDDLQRYRIPQTTESE